MLETRPAPMLRVAVAGLGAVGGVLAKRLDEEMIPGLRLTAVSTRDLNKAARLVGGFQC